MKVFTSLSIIIWFILCSTVAVAGSQRATIVNLASLPKWQIEKSENVSLNDVRKWGVEPSVDREYAVSKVEIRTYRKGNQSLQALVEKAGDPSSAYGLLTFYQNKSMKPAKGMRLTVIGRDGAYMARGVFFVRVMRPPNSTMSEEDFRSALIAIAGAAPSANAMALLPPSLPPDGLIHGTNKYVLGPVAEKQAVPSIPADLVGFQKGAELQAAAYRRNGRQVTFILISYPTLAIADSHYDAIVQSLGVNKKNGPGAVYGKLEGTYVLLVENAQTKKIASALMGQLTIKQLISWDQPPPGKPVTVQMFHLILGNLLLFILLVGMALFAGLLFFVSRRMAARWFPHWEWAQGYENSITRLNLK